MTTRHYFRAARRAALRALCSSRVMKSPRSSAARPSSTKGSAHAISSWSSPASCASSAMRSSINWRAASSTDAKWSVATMPLDPRFLFGCEGYRHAFLYHENRPVSTVKLGRQYGTEFRNKKPLSLPDDLAHALGCQPLMGSDPVPEAPCRRPCLPRSAARLAASSDRKKNDSMCLENVKEEFWNFSRLRSLGGQRSPIDATAGALAGLSASARNEVGSPAEQLSIRRFQTG